MDNASIMQVGHAGCNLCCHREHGRHVCRAPWAGSEPLPSHGILRTGGSADVVNKLEIAPQSAAADAIHFPAHSILCWSAVWPIRRGAP